MTLTLGGTSGKMTLIAHQLVLTDTQEDGSRLLRKAATLTILLHLIGVMAFVHQEDKNKHLIYNKLDLYQAIRP